MNRRSFLAALGAVVTAPVAGTIVEPASAAAPSLAPNRMFIPALGVKAPMVTRGARGGQMVVPPDARIVARYKRSSPWTSDFGTTIVAGHVTNGSQKGSLYRLGALKP
ncbi:MAG: class F sortase, partial [Nocardioides sp.]